MKTSCPCVSQWRPTAGLKMMLNELAMAKNDLTLQIDSLQDELVALKKNHEEDMMAMRAQMTGQVNVEVDAAPQIDLSAIMAQIREEYEAVAAKNQRDLDNWYQTKSENIRQEVATTQETLVTSTSEVKEIKSQLQALQIEYQSQMSMKASLEASLAEIQILAQLMRHKDHHVQEGTILGQDSAHMLLAEMFQHQSWEFCFAPSLVLLRRLVQGTFL